MHTSHANGSEQVERERAWLERAQADVLVGNLTQEEEGQLRKKVTKGAWGLGKEKAVTDVAVDKVKMYDDAFAKIQAATGEQQSRKTY